MKPLDSHPTDTSVPTEPKRWPTTTIVIHWASAAMIFGLAGAGFVMSDLPPDSSLRLLLSRSHTVSGMALMVLTVARLVVRARGRSPAPLPLPAIHRRGVGVVHGLLYATTFGIGLSGFVTGLRTAWPSYLRGDIATVPDLGHVASREAHEALVFVLLGLVVLHVGGVLVQQLRGGDALPRMLPARKTSDREGD